jgi:hypothetical protein
MNFDGETSFNSKIFLVDDQVQEYKLFVLHLKKGWLFLARIWALSWMVTRSLSISSSFFLPTLAKTWRTKLVTKIFGSHIFGGVGL